MRRLKQKQKREDGKTNQQLQNPVVVVVVSSLFPRFPSSSSFVSERFFPLIRCFVLVFSSVCIKYSLCCLLNKTLSINNTTLTNKSMSSSSWLSNSKIAKLSSHRSLRLADNNKLVDLFFYTTNNSTTTTNNTTLSNNNIKSSFVGVDSSRIFLEFEPPFSRSRNQKNQQLENTQHHNDLL